MGCFFALFSALVSDKKNSRGNEATEAVVSIGNCESCTRPISTNPGVWANASDVFLRAPSRGGRGHRAAVDIVVCLAWGEFSQRIFYRFCFSSNAHGLLQV